MPETLAVEIRSLTVRYGRLVAVHSFDLAAERGQVVALLGPNGAGKTSTIEAAEGYRKPAGGYVRVLGHDPVAERRQLAPLIGVMLQGGGVYPMMGPAEALSLFASYYRRSEDPRRLLELVGLESRARTPWRRLSGGERQRLSLALALVGRPQVAFLDEPTSGVDPEGRQVIRRVIEGLRTSGACILLTTHELEEAERLADVLYLIDKGRLVASGTLDQLAALAGPPELRWQSAPRLETASLAAVLGATVREESPGSYVAGVEGNPTTVGSLAAWLAERGLPLAGLRAGRAPLEDLYLRLTAAAPAAPEEPEGRATLARTAEEAASKGPATGERPPRNGRPPGNIEEQA
jgi:ABC-2 type transport system ATP-binding protein